ncbi:MAG: hypothetical protein HFH95_07055 [Lachnospiraceae bacterium]|nr:hypothetical protein [uncultured Acetatifactor sp.]MCI8543054.1 hypothetical protein [Lachnospiraceae bacterium]
MAKRQYMMMAAVGIVMFAAGFLASAVRDSGEQELPLEERTAEGSLEEQKAEIAPETLGYVRADTVRVRIEDDRVQWYDGRLWHDVASVEELAKEDRFCLAEEGFRAFDEQLMQEKAAKRQEEAGAEASGALSVGVKETPKPAVRPQTAVPQAPAEIPEQVDPPADNSGNNGNSGGGGNSGNQNSGGGEAAPPPVDVPGDTGGGDAGGSDSGDGENMEWSDDYL